MKISYIIPVYNIPEDMLLACLASINPHTEYEIIIIDDGSDKPVLPDAIHNDAPIHIIRQDNQGSSAARNAGIAVATGNYIQFIDGDDELIPELYNQVLEILSSEEPDILDFAMTTDKSRIRTHKACKETMSGIHHLQTRNLRVAPWSYIFKSSLLDSSDCRTHSQKNCLRFERGLKHEDERFTSQLYLRANTVVSTDIPAYYYRQREGSLQHTYNDEYVTKRLDDYLSTMIFLRNLCEPALERRICQMSMDYIYNTVCLCKTTASRKTALATLRDEGFFPLPHHRYTTKYWLFSYLADSRVGQWMLARLLPLMPKEI